jgi:hypothetical protein
MKLRLTTPQWIGLGLIVLSMLFIPLFPVVPFLPLSLKGKAAVTAALIVGGQILTWLGAFLLGKELFAYFRKYANPRQWFNKGITAGDNTAGKRERDVA